MGIIIGHPVERTSATILIPYDSYVYLAQIERQQRCGDSYGEKWLAKMKKAFEENDDRYSIHNHLRQVMDGDMGGATGKPENSWEERRWTNWSIDTMKKMLDDAGLTYEDGPEVRYCLA